MNRRAFFGFLAAAPAAPLMVRGDGGTVFHHGGRVDSQTYLVGEKSLPSIVVFDWSESSARPIDIFQRRFA